MARTYLWLTSGLMAIALAAGAGGATVARPAQPALPTVFAGHPRLIVGGYRGVSMADLRAACARPELAAQCRQIGGQHVLDDAMRYLLTGEQASADRVAAVLRGWSGCASGDVGVEHAEWGGWALAYDWAWAALPDSLRRQTSGNLVQCGLAVATELEGNGPHLWHGYSSLAASLAMMALAVDDGTAGREQVLAKAVTLFRGNALEAYAVVGGAWPEGYNYERSHFFSADPPEQYVMDALRAWDSAVAQDRPGHASIFETIAADEGDWLRGLAYHLVYGTLDAYGQGGKRTLLRGGDMPTGQAWPNKQYRPFVDAIARVYGDGVLAGWGRALESDWSFVGGDGTYHPIHRYGLPLNLPLDVPTMAPDTLPLGRIWGREDLGYVIARSAWGPGATLLAYRAGKWFTGHQHMDQGHIDLWRRGPLLVDAGVYANWGTVHREAYYMRTVAHNTLLVHLDGEDFEEHPGAGVNVNDDGQRVDTYNRRGCPQCMQSVAEWRANVGAGLHFEAGHVDAFEDGPDYTVVSSDLTAAYNSTAYSTPGNRPKVELARRDLVFVRPDLVLVEDRVRLAAGATAPRAAWHLAQRPALIDARGVSGSSNNGIVESDTPLFTVENGASVLWGQQLLPKRGRLTAVGGPDYRYWVDGANRAGGASGLEGAPAEPGLWRVEMGPADRDTDNVMVTSFAMHDIGGVAQASAAALLPPAQPGLGATVVISATDVARRWQIVRDGALPAGRVEFATFPVDTTHPVAWLAADLAPGRPYRLAWRPAGGGGAFTGLVDAVASAEGVLRLDTPAIRGTVALGYCPPPPGARSDWRALCDAGASATPTATATVGPTPTAGVTPTAGATATALPPSGRVLLPWSHR
jgi:hypothetical protein